jgi:hypothetical protein
VLLLGNIYVVAMLDIGHEPTRDVGDLELDAGNLDAELLGHLLEEEVDVGVHGAKLVLLAARVADRVQSTRSLILIPIVNLIGGEKKQRGFRRRKKKTGEDRV